MIVAVACTFLALTQAVRTSIARKPFACDWGWDCPGSNSIDPMPSNYSRNAEYCVNVHVGGKPYCLDLDTGSSDIGIMGKGCTTCSRRNHPSYDPQKTGKATDCNFCNSHKTRDTTLRCRNTIYERNQQCTFSMDYMDGSGWTAALYEDNFAFDGAESMNFTQAVGAIYKVSDYEDPPEIDGIVGFGDRSESAANVPTAMDSLVAAHQVENKFALCLRKDYGRLYLGEEPGVTDVEGTVYTERLKTDGLWDVGLKDVLVDGKSIGVASKKYTDGGAIVDSGTSDTCFSTTAFKALQRAFTALCRSGKKLKGLCDQRNGESLLARGQRSIFEDKCVEMTAEEREMYPTITLIYADGARTEHTPEGYLRNDVWLCQGKGRGNQYSIAIADCGGDGEGTIIGDSLLTEHVVVFDRANSKVGFVPGHSECP